MDTQSAGLIPACAGKTNSPVNLPSHLPAHPRVCGENHYARSIPRMYSGSSPRVRGKLSPSRYASHARRLIPACAGKTVPRGVFAVPRRAHPRVCGENTGCRPRAEAKLGSSPRVRGKPFALRSDNTPSRLIPACAGKTLRIMVSCHRIWAHPRVCGENILEGLADMSRGGSSPRVRGKLG